MSGWHLSSQHFSWGNLYIPAIYPLCLTKVLPNFLDPLFGGQEFFSTKILLYPIFFKPNVFWSKIFKPLHFGRPFFLTKIYLGPQFFWPKDFFGPKIFVTKNVFGPHFFWDTKSLWTKLFLDSKSFHPKYYWTKNFMDSTFLVFNLLWFNLHIKTKTTQFSWDLTQLNLT